MSEVIYPPEDQEYTRLSDMEFLSGMGFNFVTETTAIKRHDAKRTAKFDNYDYRDPVQRAARIIDVAYYALELSPSEHGTALKPLDEVIAAVEKLEPEEAESSAELINDYLVAIKVDEILYRAHNVASAYDPSQLIRLRQLTSSYTHENTGALAALHNMATSSERRGNISSGIARQSENLLRMAIAVEKGIPLP